MAYAVYMPCICGARRNGHGEDLRGGDEEVEPWRVEWGAAEKHGEEEATDKELSEQLGVAPRLQK